MSNPYQSPPNAAFDQKFFQDRPLPPGGSEFGWIQQVRVFAILNAVQGLLEFPLGVMLLIVGGMFPAMMAMDRNNPNRPVGGPEPPEEMMWIVMAMYMTIGGVLLLISALRLFAAYRNFYFKGRVLGFVSMGLGVASMFTCYCAPTSIAILIYGLILYLNPAVKAAFDMGEQGRSVAEIYAAFMPYRTYQPPPGVPPTAPPGSGPFA